ncbi:hypothetical protein, partial [Plasmodium yoelii yoelii]
MVKTKGSKMSHIGLLTITFVTFTSDIFYILLLF